ncbi:MAG: hypothetical protein M9965_08590 [Anaerolineae bacterium]|nr:hypothetical protein [Anaerolineae bacterium]
MVVTTVFVLPSTTETSRLNRLTMYMWLVVLSTAMPRGSVPTATEATGKSADTLRDDSANINKAAIRITVPMAMSRTFFV